MSETQFVTLKAEIAANSARLERMFGRDFMVAPVVAVKAGVLNGQLLPAEEISAFYQAWNGRPLVMRHPTDASGEYLSANSPRVLEAHQLGQLFGVEAKNDRLTGEAWFDVDLSGKSQDGQNVLATLRNGGVVEVSTAYWCVIEAGQGVANGVPYDGIQRAIRPDHLAILPDELGACSVEDGCGVGRANSKTEDSMPEEKLMANEDAEVENLEAQADEDCNGCDEEVTANDEEVAEDEEVSAAETVSEFEQFAAEFGGVESLRGLLQGIQANAKRTRDELVEKVLANKSLNFGADDLEGMSDAALEKLAKVGVKANASYAGAAGSKQTVKGNGLKVYKAPTLDD